MKTRTPNGLVPGPPYCRANVTPKTMQGYTPCMRILPCPIHPVVRRDES